MKHRMGIPYQDGDYSYWHRICYRGVHRRIMRFGFWVAAAVMGVGSGFVYPNSAQASVPVVVVESHLSGRYDVLLRRTVKFTDRFTMSHMVYGKCVSNKRCITVRMDTHLPYDEGLTTFEGGGSWRTSIRFRLNQHSYSNVNVLRLMEHEFGHAFGLGHVSGYCNLMLAHVACGGKHLYTPPEYFTGAQRRVLGKM